MLPLIPLHVNIQGKYQVMLSPKIMLLYAFVPLKPVLILNNMDKEKLTEKLTKGYSEAFICCLNSGL